MSTTEILIKQALEKWDEWVKFYATESEKKLQKRMRINHAQYAIAQKDKDEKACELLDIMEKIIVEAQFYKQQHNIADVPSEMEQFLEEMDLMEEKAEERKKLLQKEKHLDSVRRDDVVDDSPSVEDTSRFESRPDRNDQLSLF